MPQHAEAVPLHAKAMPLQVEIMQEKFGSIRNFSYFCIVFY